MLSGEIKVHIYKAAVPLTSGSNHEILDCVTEREHVTGKMEENMT